MTTHKMFLLTEKNNNKLYHFIGKRFLKGYIIGTKFLQHKLIHIVHEIIVDKNLNKPFNNSKTDRKCKTTKYVSNVINY